MLSVVVRGEKFIHMKRVDGYKNYKITYNFQSMSDMQSEKDYFYHYNVFVNNHDFEKVF